jgi:hypothetical protein
MTGPASDRVIGKGYDRTIPPLSCYKVAAEFQNHTAVTVPMPNHTPSEATVVLREELLARCWPTSVDVDRRSGGRFASNGQWAADRRAAGELLGVLSASEHTYRYPDFQFDKQGHIRSKVKALLTALALREEFHNTKDQDKTGWRRTFWLYGATFALAGSDGKPRVPAEVFLIDPDAVIEAARKEANLDPDVQW